MNRIEGERRTHRRYNLELPLRYIMLKKRHAVTAGTGITLDMSSGGVGFVAETPLDIGSIVELCIFWPALGDADTVELRIVGEVVRTSGLTTALTMKRHRFVQRAALSSTA